MGWQGESASPLRDDGFRHDPGHAQRAGIADTALLGSTLYPEMEKRGYSPRLGLGTIFNSGLLAAIIPPSGLAVLTATLAHVPVGKLLLAASSPA